MSAIPEVGAYLGRMAAPPPLGDEDPVARLLEPARLELLDSLFAAAARARDAEEEEAARILGEAFWLDLWRRAAVRAVASLVEHLTAALAAAGREARAPHRVVAERHITPHERAQWLAIFEAAGIPLEQAVARWAAQAEGGGYDRSWVGMLRAHGMALEESWDRLRVQMAARHQEGMGRVAALRAWSRPRRPLWISSILVVALGAVLGLMIGGYLPAPAWFRPAIDAWWRFPWP